MQGVRQKMNTTTAITSPNRTRHIPLDEHPLGSLPVESVLLPRLLTKLVQSALIGGSIVAVLVVN